MTNAKDCLKAASLLIRKAKEEISDAAEKRRILPHEELVHELKDLALELGSDIGTIENALHQLERTGPSSKRFVFREKAQATT